MAFLTALDWDSLGDGAIPGVISKVGKSTKVLNQLETPEYLDSDEAYPFVVQGGLH